MLYFGQKISKFPLVERLYGPQSWYGTDVNREIHAAAAADEN